MDKNDLRLNQAKRKAVTNAWKETVWKRAPTEFDTNLYDAVTNFKQHERMFGMMLSSRQLKRTFHQRT